MFDMSRLRRIVALATLTVFVNLVPSAAQITSNVWERILLVQTPSGKGTAFSMDIDGRQYLITAKHVVEGLTGKHTISFRDKEAWSPIEVTVYPCADPVDVAVLVPPRVLTTNIPLEPATAAKAIATQEVYFVGFPFGSSAGDHSPIWGSRPIPLAKHGILSTIVIDGVIRVDAYNNPGFSGAPIVFRDLYDRASTPTFYVLGVVKGYYPELTHVTNPEPVKQGEDLSKIESWRIQEMDGKKVVLRDTPQLVPLNSGILVGYSIDDAIKMIHEHPDGPKIPKQ
jgi:hypothetical protein